MAAKVKPSDMLSIDALFSTEEERRDNVEGRNRSQNAEDLPQRNGLPPNTALALFRPCQISTRCTMLWP